MANFVPSRYREVSLATVDGPLTAERLRAHLLGRDVYRTTRYLVVRHRTGTGTALVEVERATTGELFGPASAVRVLASPAECAYVVAPDADTGVPSTLARVAREQAPGARAVVVEGRYRHVSFILDPAPLRVVVRDVVPPHPPKLLDQARRVLEVAEDLPPVELVPDVVDLAELARAHPAARYLLPCRGSGAGVEGAEVDFLDQRPPRRPWTLLGCDRSRAIHHHFYGDLPPTVDTCPRRRPPPAGTPTLTKCCLLEERTEVDDQLAVVPWGASLEMVRHALGRLVEQALAGTAPAAGPSASPPGSPADPAWAPV